jgi:DNA-binding IclR family transcriptional regulator
MLDENRGRTLTTTRTSLRVLELVLEHEGLTLAELDDLVDKPKSTLHSHLHTLLDCRYLVRDGETYTASYRLSLFGGVVGARFPYDDVVRETVEELAEATGEEANFTVLEHGRLLMAHGASGGSAAEEKDTNFRTEYYLHNTAAGKAILAEMDRSRVERVLDAWKLPQESEATIVDRDRLFDSLAETADRGYGVLDEESAPGLVAVGVPIRDDGGIVGGLSVGGPKYRIDVTRLHGELADTLLDLGGTLEEELRA